MSKIQTIQTKCLWPLRALNTSRTGSIYDGEKDYCKMVGLLARHEDAWDSEKGLPSVMVATPDQAADAEIERAETLDAIDKDLTIPIDNHKKTVTITVLERKIAFMETWAGGETEEFGEVDYVNNSGFRRTTAFSDANAARKKIDNLEPVYEFDCKIVQFVNEVERSKANLAENSGKHEGDRKLGLIDILNAINNMVANNARESEVEDQAGLSRYKAQQFFGVCCYRNQVLRNEGIDLFEKLQGKNPLLEMSKLDKEAMRGFYKDETSWDDFIAWYENRPSKNSTKIADKNKIGALAKATKVMPTASVCKAILANDLDQLNHWNDHDAVINPVFRAIRDEDTQFLECLEMLVSANDYGILESVHGYLFTECENAESEVERKEAEAKLAEAGNDE